MVKKADLNNFETTLFYYSGDSTTGQVCETTNWAETEESQDATFFFLTGPILFLYHEECQVSSNLNSNLFRFHCVRPNVGISWPTMPLTWE